MKEGDNWGIAPIDGSGDTHPDFPEDSDLDLKEVSLPVCSHVLMD